MIPRYARKEIEQLWSDDYRFKTWFRVEAHVCTAQSMLGQIPKESAAHIGSWRERVEAGEKCWNQERILEIEKDVKHDVIAFLTNVAEQIGEDGQYLHFGLTSSDLLDTALALILRDVIDVIASSLDGLLDALHQKALAYKQQPIMGRSHGMYAEPTTVGIKFAGFYSEFLRHKIRLQQARKEISVGSLSGAVGVYGGIDPQVEKLVLEKLDLQIENVATQVIPRDRHAFLLTTLGLLAGGIERLATEIRLLQRSDVNEVQEPFSKKQKGSSAMPHKRNPILSENLTGLARLIRSNVQPALENIALWHERDISHSSVERIILPQATILTDFALHRLTQIVAGLHVHTEKIEQHMEESLGLYASGALLLAFIEKGLEKDIAYRSIQKLSHKAWDEQTPLPAILHTYLNTLAPDHPLYGANFDELFSFSYHIRHVETIFSRTFPA